MSTETVANSTGDVVKELAKVAGISAAVTAAEVAGAVALLVTVGFVATKLQDRKNKKLALTVE